MFVFINVTSLHFVLIHLLHICSTPLSTPYQQHTLKSLLVVYPPQRRMDKQNQASLYIEDQLQHKDG